VELAIEAMQADEDLSPFTVARLGVLMRQFARFVERGHDADSLDLVTPAMVRGFVAAPTADGVDPGPSLQQFRRLAVRSVYRATRRLGIADGDPTLDLVLPSRTPGAFRPLADDEIELGRSAVVGSGRTRATAAWALCEATARTGELAAIRRADVDLDAGTVWVHGTPRTAARLSSLTPWGVGQLTRRLLTLDEDPETLVVGGTRPGAALAQSSSVGLLSQALTRAGLRQASGVRPSSIAAWAGRRIFDETGRLDIAANRLGLRSLDRTARFIGWDWSDDLG
jgi:integrase/recombinase XerC